MSTKYKVLIARNAQKQIKKLDATVLPRVISCLDSLEQDAHPTGVEKLNQNPNFWRLKAGVHRIVYTIFEEKRIIIVALVSPRREVYREVANLNERHLVQIASNEPGPRIAVSTRH